MGRLLSCFLLLCCLTVAMPCPASGVRRMDVQPVFFSMLFPQLIPEWMLDKAQEKEAI